MDGFGNALFMDDANIPSLVSLPYLGYISPNNSLYQQTRAAAWSNTNPWFFQGSTGAGVGGPHEGLDMIWPMSIMAYALTSTDDNEILTALNTLKQSTAGTGFMHESFNKNDYGSFTRSWFAWANSLFGELILHLAETRPYLIFK